MTPNRVSGPGRADRRPAPGAVRQARMARVRTIRRRVIAGALALFVATWMFITLMLVTGHDPVLARQRSSALASAAGAGTTTTASTRTASATSITPVRTSASGTTGPSATGASSSTTTSATPAVSTATSSASSATGSSGVSAVTSSQS